jgi:hypothetical protein
MQCGGYGLNTFYVCCIFRGLMAEINNLSKVEPYIEVNMMSMSIHISIFYLRPYVISHNSQCGYIIGTLKRKMGLKLQWRIGKNELRLIIDSILTMKQANPVHRFRDAILYAKCSSTLRFFLFYSLSLVYYINEIATVRR